MQYRSNNALMVNLQTVQTPGDRQQMRHRTLGQLRLHFQVPLLRIGDGLCNGAKRLLITLQRHRLHPVVDQGLMDQPNDWFVLITV